MIRQALLGELRFEAENTRKLFNAITDDVLDYRPNDFNWSIADIRPKFTIGGRLL